MQMDHLQIETIANISSNIQKEFKTIENCLNFYKKNILVNLNKIGCAEDNSCSSKISNIDEIINTLQNIYKNVSELNIKLFNDISVLFKMIEIREHPYKKIDLNQYREHDQSTCLIVNIKENSDLIYIYDLKNTTEYNDFYDKLYTDYKSHYFKELKILPPTNEVFGMLINNCFYRIIRRNNHIYDGKFNGFLIDHGKTMELPVENKFYLLTSDIQNFPATAICCKVIGIINESSSEFFKYGLHKKYNFTVNKIYKEYLAILITYTNPFTQELSEMEANWFSIKPFNNLSVVKCNNNVPDSILDTSTYIVNNPLEISNNFKEYLEISSQKLFNKSCDYNSENFEYKLKDDDKTMGILSLLYEEPEICTTNAMKAIMGHVPKDELRICPFTNDKGSCFKGIHCTKEHIPKIPGGWTKDQRFVLTNTDLEIEIPSVGEYISIVPRHLISITAFYGNIISNKNSSDNLLYPTTLEQLTLLLNDSNKIMTYREFVIDKLPEKFDLVLAKYEDGLYYRARIISEYETYNFFRVFYLDYGNKDDVLLSDLRKWEKQFEILPFQAVRFELYHIKTNINAKSNLELVTLAQNFLIEHFLDCKFVAKIVNNTNELIVKINFALNDEVLDLSDFLVKQGFAEYSDSYYIDTNSANFTTVPG